MARTRGEGVVPPVVLAEAPLAMIDAALARKRALQDPVALSGPTRTPLVDFIRGGWKVVDPKPYLHNWHISAKSEHLQAVSDGQISKLIIAEPPSYAKSLVTSVFWPAWQWGPNAHPETRFLCTSYGGAEAAPALRDAERARQLMTSQWYQSAWGMGFHLSASQNAKGFYKNDHHGQRLSAGMDGSISGGRADFIIIDDPTKTDAAGNGLYQMPSLAEILHASSVWESTLRTRALDDGSAVVLIMQRLHEDDLAGYFMKQDGWTILRLPALYEAEHKCRVFINGQLFFEDPRTIDGEPLHPARTLATSEAYARKASQPWIHACTPAETPILMADWTCRPISQVRPGDEIVGFATQRGPRTKGQTAYDRCRIVKTTVKQVFTRRDYVWTAKMQSGRPMRCTKSHRWYVGKNHVASNRQDTGDPQKLYRETAVGRRLRFVCPTEDHCSDEHRTTWAYLAGLIDGEGSVKHQSILGLTQGIDANPGVCASMLKTLDRLGLSYYTEEREPSNKYGRACGRTLQICVRDTRAVYRKLLRFVPEFGKRDQVIASLYRSGQMFSEADTILALERPVEETVYALETTTGNYIAWGYASSNSQDQQRPSPLEGGMIKRFERWETWPPVLDDVIMVVDCAFKDGEDNSWVVMQCWGRRETTAYLLDQVRDHLDLPATLDALYAFCLAHPTAGAKYVEDKANGTGVVQMLRNRVPGLMSTSADDQGDLCLKKFCMGSKEAKLSAVAPYYMAGNVKIPSSAYLLASRGEDWTAEYVHELTTFPRSRFNDQVDASAMGVWKLLSSFEGHVNVSELLAVGANQGQLLGQFEKAYGGVPPPQDPGFDLERAAWGRGNGNGDWRRRAFGG